MSHNHIVHKCISCGVIVMQCRCMSENKTIVSDMTCIRCKNINDDDCLENEAFNAFEILRSKGVTAEMYEKMLINKGVNSDI